MCNIVWRSTEAKFPTYLYLAGIAEQNSDGFGAMWVRGDKLHVVRELEFTHQAYLNLPTDVDILIHFRYATHGTVTKENVHPFRFMGKDGEYGLMHNGILSIKPVNDTWSDTRELAENRLIHVARRKGWRGVKKGIKRAINGDRIAVMRNDGTTKFFGSWHHDKDTGLYTSSPVWEFTYRRSSYSYTRDWRTREEDAYEYWNSAASAGRSYDSIEDAVEQERAFMEERKERKAVELDTSYIWAEDPDLWSEEEIQEQRNILFNRNVSLRQIESMSMADMLRLDAKLDEQEWELARWTDGRKDDDPTRDADAF